MRTPEGGYYITFDGRLEYTVDSDNCDDYCATGVSCPFDSKKHCCDMCPLFGEVKLSADGLELDICNGKHLAIIKDDRRGFER